MANTPNIRFKGFADDWEQHRLETVSDVRDGTHDSPTYQNEGHPFVTSKNVKNGFINYDDVQYISDEDFEEINKRSKVDVNDILMGMIGTIGNLALIRTEPDFAIKNVALIKDTKQVSYLYLYQYLQSKNVEKQLFLGMDGGTQKFLALKKIRELNILVPSEDEQLQIGGFLENLDDIITLYQCKCDETKKLKKYMLQKMFPQNGANVPEIRFGGFTDAWEQRKLGDTLCSLQNNTLSRAELTYEEGAIKNVHYGDILVKYGEVLNVKNEQIPNIIDTTVAEKYKASFLQNGDVIFADTAEDETVGKCSEIAGLTDETALSGLHTIPYRPQLKFATGYLGYYLNSSVFHQQLIPLMQGIKVTSISKSAMQNTDIIYPKCFEEQEKIGAYFMHLAHLITLHQQKCDQLKEVKRFMLQNMFPQKG